MRVQWVVMPGSEAESWTLLGDDQIPLDPVKRFLRYLASIEKSPNTVNAYAHAGGIQVRGLTRRGLLLPLEARLSSAGPLPRWATLVRICGRSW